jgi:Ser/Thr protein kinase RdoA (MazF antagonist)
LGHVTLDARCAEEIAAQYGIGGRASLTGPVARGEVGQVWRLVTSQGAYAVKQPFDPVPVHEIDDDAAFQDAVRARGVPMPAVIRTKDGDVAISVAGAQVRVYEWVDLGERDARLDPATVGRLVAAIHQVHHIGNNPIDAWYTDPVGAPRWDELIVGLRAAGAEFADALAARRDELVALEALLEWPHVHQTCHRDLFADNVLRTPSGSLCVIDWENSGLADPGQELGLVLFEYSCGDPARARELSRAYVAAGGPGRIRGPGDFSMVIAQLGHIGEIACRRWLDPRRTAERAHNAGRVDEFLTTPITLPMIDDLLRATAD